MKEILDILEKKILVDDDSNWKPDSGLLMHIASYNDQGAHPDNIEEAKKIILDEGGKPRLLKLRVIVEIEEV